MQSLKSSGGCVTTENLICRLRDRVFASKRAGRQSSAILEQKKPPRVAIVYHFFPHYRKGVLDAIVEAGFDSTFFGDPVDRYQGIPSFRFEGHSDFRAAPVKIIGKISFQWAAVLASLSKEFDVLILLANPNFFTTWLAALLGRFSGKRVIFWGHGFLSEKRDIKNYVRRVFFSLGHAQYLYGYRAKCIAEKFGFQAGNLYVGFNSLDYQSQLRTRHELLARHVQRQSSAELCVLGVSRLTDKCEYDLLLRAVALAQKTSGQTFRLTLIGGGPAEKKLKDLAVALGLKVDFVGELYDEKAVATYIFDSDVVVSPGKVGLTAMHSLMFGAPVITHSDMDRQMPEVEAIVHGFSGMLFPYGNLPDLAGCLIAVPRVFHDRRQTQENCFSIIDETYNPRKQCEVLADAIYGRPARQGNDIVASHGDKYASNA